MDEATKRLLDVLLESAQLIALVVAGSWAFLRFRREGVHQPRIEFGVDCEFFGPQRGYYLAAFAIHASNKGHIEHRFEQIRLKVLGLPANQPVEEWKERPPLVRFPQTVVRGANIIPEEIDHYFVRPGVDQTFTYTIRIPEEVRHIVARATFKYSGTGDLHTAERVFAVAPAFGAA